jgi:hypothetical protein
MKESIALQPMQVSQTLLYTQGKQLKQCSIMKTSKTCSALHFSEVKKTLHSIIHKFK